MKTIQTSSEQVRFQQMLKELSSLKLSELEKFVKQVNKLLERRKSPEFIKKEKELIEKIKIGGPSKEIFQKHDELLSKSVRGIITDEENEELLRLVPIFDNWTLERVKLMIELADLWKTSLEDVRKRLKIKPAPTIYA